MRTKLFLLIIRLMYGRPWAATGALAAVTGLLLYPAITLDFNFDWTGFLPPGSTAVETERFIEKQFQGVPYDMVFVVLQTTEPGQHRLLINAADKMAEAFRTATPGYVVDVDYRIDPQMRRYFSRLDDSRVLGRLDSRQWAAMESMLTRGAEENSASYALQLERARARMQTAFVPGGSIELDPLGFLDRLQMELVPGFGPRIFDSQGEYSINRDGRLLVMAIKPARPATDIQFAHDFVRYLERQVKDVLKNEGPPMRGSVRASFAGSHVDVTRAIQYVQGDLRYILYFGSALALLLFILVYRKVEAIFYVLVPVAVGIVWTLGLAGMIYREVTVATLVFVFATVTLSFSFGMQIYTRFLDELYRRRNYREALEVAYLRTGKALSASAIGCALVFALLNLTPFEGMRELGTVAALGVLCSLTSTLFVLPPMLSFKSRWRSGQVRPVALPKLGLDSVAGAIAGYPRATLGMAFLLTAYFAYWALDLRYVESPAPFVPPTESEEVMLNVNYYLPYPAELPAPSHPILALVEGRTLQEALERNDRLAANLSDLKEPFRLISYESLRRILPSERTQSAMRAQISALPLSQIESSIEKTGLELGYNVNAFTPLFAVLGRALALPVDDLFIEYKPGGENDEEMAKATRRYMRYSAAPERDGGGTTYSVVTAIYPSTTSFPDGGAEGESLQAFLARAGANVEGIRYTSAELLGRDVAPEMRRALARTALLGVIVLMLTLTLHFHSLLRALAVLAPVTCVTVWVFGAMALLDIHFHFYTLIMLPSLIILAIDHNLHFLQHYSEKGEMWPTLAVVGRAIFTTSFTAIMSLGVLAFAHYGGLRHIGLLTIVGSGFAMLGAMTLLPAAMRLRELGAWPRGLIGIDEGVGEGFEDV